MQEFIRHLKKGEFRVPICNTCGRKAWPPSNRCPHCLSKTSLKKVLARGILLEFSRSHIIGKEGVFGLVEMSGIRLVGSFGDHKMTEGMKVKMAKCGLGQEGSPFYFFVPANS